MHIDLKSNKLELVEKYFTLYKTQITNFAVIFACALILNIPAFYNGYVFLFQDSADYLASWTRFYRLPVYGNFTYIGRIFGSPWPIAIAQGLIVSHLIFLINRISFGKVRLELFTLQIAILTVFSSLPYVSAQIMADIFTPIMFLGLYILLFHRKKISIIEKNYLKVLVVFSAMAHITNIYLGVGLVIFSAFVILIRDEDTKANLKTLGRGLGLLAFAAAYVVGLNAFYFSTWKLSPASSVFALANLIQNGTAQTYLEQACSTQKLKICKFAHAIPNSSDFFLWSRKSPLDKGLGSFRGFSSEAQFIVRDTIATYPKDVAMHAFNDFKRTFVVHAPAKELNSSVARSSVRGVLRIFYGAGARDKFFRTKQANDALPYQLLANIDNIIFPISLVLVALLSLFSLRNIRDSKSLLPLMTLVFLLGNNFLCALGSGVFDRYQARVSWLLVFAIIIGIGTIIENNKLAKAKLINANDDL